MTTSVPPSLLPTLDESDPPAPTRAGGFDGGRWYVHKFGGTSLASADCFLRCAAIVNDQRSDNDDHDLKKGSDRIAVVVSAMGGSPKVTDLLLSTVVSASRRNESEMKETLRLVEEKHFECVDALRLSNGEDLKAIIRKDISDIRDILKTVSLMKWRADRISELVSGYGELWSGRILASLLGRGGGRFAFLDARRVITIDEEAGGSVCWEVSADKLKKAYGEEQEKHREETDDSAPLDLVVTGYVASNTEGVSTTLQRDGSDYSASIMGRLLSCISVCIWTDVDGVLSADPRRVPQAFVIPEVSFDEAMELAYFGAKVIHPKTMQPAILARPQIPIYIRNTFNPQFQGTRIFMSSTTHKDRDRCICGFATVDGMALVNLEGSGLVGVPGVASRLFGALERIGVNVVLISQASSEHSITFATLERQAGMAKEAIEEAFGKEMRHGQVTSVDVVAPCSIIAAVGDGMSHTTGVSGRFFSALGNAKINILAISQGCSERNISAVIANKESTRALRAVHAAFRLSHSIVRVAIVGTNELGMSLLKILESQRDKHLGAFEMDVQVCAVLTESGDLVSLVDDTKDDSITNATLNSAINGKNSDGGGAVAAIFPGGISALPSKVQSEYCPHIIIFDCTASESVATYHPSWLDSNMHVITANSTALSGPSELRSALSNAEKRSGKNSAKYLYEATVGGAMPVISSLRDLLNSGDRIRRVDGILSTSMSYIFHRVAPPPGENQSLDYDEQISHGAFRGSRTVSSTGRDADHCSFSQAVKEAIALGLMEEDPLKDLSNEYTARCLMVLGKELGLAGDYDVEKIQSKSDMLTVDVVSDDGTTVKLPLKDVSAYDKCVEAQLDKQIETMVREAAASKCVPRHVSSIDVFTSEIQVNIMNVPENHIFAITPPSCECVRLFTERHRRYPLIIEGPSAGVDSTASGLLAELLHLMRSKIEIKRSLARTDTSAFLI